MNPGEIDQLVKKLGATNDDRAYEEAGATLLAIAIKSHLKIAEELSSIRDILDRMLELQKMRQP